MYLSKATMCLPGAKSWIRTRALHSVDGGTRERSYENVFSLPLFLLPDLIIIIIIIVWRKKGQVDRQASRQTGRV